MKSLETICRDFLNIGKNIPIFEILNFWEKYDGFRGDIIFLINFNGEEELVEEDDIISKNKCNFYIFAFTPIPNLSLNPDYCILYCKNKDLHDNWKYLKVKSNEETTKKIWKKPRIPLRVFLYRNI